ncbi:reverse transcriptase [Trichonephila clavipes]|nr:reverse transcriptase [Trichonephila clavipes]
MAGLAALRRVGVPGNERAEQGAESTQPEETLATVGPILKHLERVKAVDRFRLTNGHDFLGVYLHWLGVAANEACPICGHARMDRDHLLQCTGLGEYTRLTTSSVGTGWLGVKWSRSQARALDK